LIWVLYGGEGRLGFPRSPRGHRSTPHTPQTTESYYLEKLTVPSDIANLANTTGLYLTCPVGQD